MSLADSFNIMVHSTDIDGNRTGPHSVTLEYKSIAMRHPLETNEEDILKCKEDKKPLTRIHLTHAMRSNNSASQYMKFNIDVLETVDEIQDLIDTAQIEHIKKLQKLRLNIL